MAMNCVVCDAPGAKHEVTSGRFSLSRCVSCQSVFMDEPPSADTVQSLYENPYDNATTGYYPKREKKLRRNRKRARILAAYVTTGKSFLEIGSSAGFMTEAMRELGFAATGVEPDAPGVAYARREFPGCTFHNGLFEEVAARGDLGRYDAIYCSEVIEHVPAPGPFVAAIARHAKPGAVLNVTTPDVTHWNKPADLTQWNEFCPPSHCVYFSPNGLNTLLGKHGFDVFRHRFNWKAGIQFYARKVA